MLAGEIALTLIVVVGAGLLGTSLLRIYRSGLGFEGHGLLLVNLDLTKQGWSGPDSLHFYREFADEAARIPGVTQVSYANPTPLSGSIGWDDWYANGKKKTLYESTIAPDYFRTMRIPLRSGRDFTWDDIGTATPLKAVINQAAAEFFFPGTDPVGQQIRNGDGKDAKTYEVIGVVGNTKYGDPREELHPVIYDALSQQDLKFPIYGGILRIIGKPDSIVATVRSIAARLAPGAPDPVFLTMDRQINEIINSQRMIAMLAVFFALCALLVTGIGLYGTLAYSTARRTSEIGIRSRSKATADCTAGLPRKRNGSYRRLVSRPRNRAPDLARTDNAALQHLSPRHICHDALRSRARSHSLHRVAAPSPTRRPHRTHGSHPLRMTQNPRLTQRKMHKNRLKTTLSARIFLTIFKKCHPERTLTLNVVKRKVSRRTRTNTL
jgi:hypothetical protein